MTRAAAEAKCLHHAGLALFTLTRVLRENLDYVDMPGGSPLSIRDQHGLMLAAEYIAERVYTALEHQAIDAEDEDAAEASQ